MVKKATDPALVEFSSFPVLLSVGLGDEDMATLASQGFVSAERLGTKVIHKLRFRRRGRQQVRYIGSAARATAVQAELDMLQRARNLHRQIAALPRSVTDALRDARERLRPFAESQGYVFHGHALRKRRQRP